MLAGKLGNALFVAIAVVNMAALSVTAAVDEWKPPKEFTEVSSRITALGRTENLSKAQSPGAVGGVGPGNREEMARDRCRHLRSPDAQDVRNAWWVQPCGSAT